MAGYVIMPKADYTAACDATRVKTGKTEVIKSGDLATEIGGISVAPDGTDVTFGATKSETITHAYYNDVRLPKLPEDLDLTTYPYVWMSYTARGYYIYANTSKAYRYPSSDYPLWIRCDGSYVKYECYDGEFWEFDRSGNNASVVVSYGLTWSNYDVPTPVASSSDIYFEGTEPVDDTEVFGLIFPEREEAYSFTSEDIANLGYAIQQKTNDYTLSTVAEYVDRVLEIENTSDIPNAEEASF